MAASRRQEGFHLSLAGEAAQLVTDTCVAEALSSDGGGGWPGVLSRRESIFSQ